MQPEVRRTVLYSAVIFTTLFIAHIIAAAKDADLLFRIIAMMITIQTFFLGGTFLLFLIDSTQSIRRDAFHIGSFISLPLSIGLGWAYAGMQWSWMILMFPLIAIGMHLFLRYGLQSKSVI